MHQSTKQTCIQIMILESLGRAVKLRLGTDVESSYSQKFVSCESCAMLWVR